MPSSRRLFLRRMIAGGVASTFGGRLLPGQSDGLHLPLRWENPKAAYGFQLGDPSTDGVTVWSHVDRPARMLVEVGPNLRGMRQRWRGPIALPELGGTAKVRLHGLPPGERHFIRVRFQGIEDSFGPTSEPMVGQFRTAPAPSGPGAEKRSSDLTILWSGDTCGQGFGIDRARGGLKTYAAMAAEKPDLFLHCGDMIYADNPLPETIDLPDGTTWNNLVTPAKSKVAETLEEFRGNYAYNLLDENVRNFASQTAQIVAWDDHEVTNNWYPGETLGDDRYTERRVSVLAARARRALFEWTPIHALPHAPERIFRKIPYGPRVDIFVLDLRSDRGGNSPNRQRQESGETAILGKRQLDWFTKALAASTATWKLIVCDMPIGLKIADGENFEGIANGDGPPLGRELEIAALLRSVQQKKVRNLVWLTADVHYTAAHHYSPERATFTEFDPFWEFVSGPLHAGSFGPNPLDPTFGPRVVYQSETPRQNAAPSEGHQFYGKVKVIGSTGELRVSLHDVHGREVFAQELAPHEE